MLSRGLKFCAVAFVVAVKASLIAAFSEHHAPMLTHEPPAVVRFLNSSGTALHCGVVGNPRPIITWVLVDGSPAADVRGLRTALPNGTLFFYPFRAENYRQDVHSAIYRCVASNALGKVGSRDIRVRAVVRQRYDVQVYDEFVIRGNTAVLRCHVPSFVTDHVIVTTWVREDGITIVSNVASGGRYSVLPNGELHIRNTVVTDGFKSYRCLTKNVLSGETQLSVTSGRLIITDPQGSVLPRLSDVSTSIHVAEGMPAELTCVAQAYPLPAYRWFKKEGGRLIPVDRRRDIIQLSGSLYFRQVSMRDSGNYVCVVSNNVGEGRIESILTVTSPLVVTVSPQRLEADAGRSITINCNVTGYPVDKIAWVKDQRPLLSNDGRVRLLSPTTVYISATQREDKGVYQCYAWNGEDCAQASAELQLGETAPVFLETFSEKTLHPGGAVSLQCTAVGTPLPQVTWSLDGLPVPDNERVRVGDYVSRNGDVISHVNISSIRVEDGGHYSCAARNEVGEVIHSARLNIYGPPVVRPMSSLAVIAGEDLYLKCRVAGYPIGEIHWKKDGRKLPALRRQQVFQNGTLLIEDVQRSEDEGSYSCVARNKEGLSAEGTVKIKVKEKPVILPFSFPREIQEGMKVRVTCSAASGDPPFSLSWLKDNKPIESDAGVTISALSEDFSALIIESATPQHNGMYTCVVTNDVASVNQSTSLVVRVPPRWRIQPSDASVVVGKSLTLDCQATGHPQPQIRWEKATGSSGGRDYRPISTSYHYQIFENGSLSIQDVTLDDSGHYLCLATNGIGPGLSSVVSVSVHVAPKFESQFRTKMVRRGERVVLPCQVTGDMPISLAWFRDKQPLNAKNDPRFEIKETSSATGVSSELVLFSAGRSDSALYTCFASNEFGKDDTNIQLIVQEAPDSPREVKINRVGSRFAVVTWEPPFSGNSLITQYVIQYTQLKPYSNEDSSVNVTVPGTESTTEISHLRPASKYELFVLAENAIGVSSPGQKVFFTTEEEVPEGPPTSISIEALDSQSLRVVWQSPSRRLQNGIIKGYYVGYKEHNSSEPFLFKTVDVVGTEENRLETELRGLKKYTRYSIVVQAFNSKGAGPRSDPISGITLDDVPSLPPEKVACTPVSSQSIKAMWVPPPSSAIHGIMEGFKVLYKVVDDWHDHEDMELIVQKDASEVQITKLKKFTNYSVAVLAFTRRGDGVLSEPVFCKTHEDVPGPPADIKAIPMLPDAILISWKPPVQPNGIVLRYTLHQRTIMDSSQDTLEYSVSASQLYFEALKLKRNRRYEFWVTASTAVGESEATRVLSQTTADSIPARIASFSDELRTHRKSRLFLPCKAVGIPSPTRTWTFRGQAIADRNNKYKILNNGTLKVSDVDDTDAGNYTCRVENSYGADEIVLGVIVAGYSSEGNAIAPPTALQITGATTSSLEIRWKTTTRSRLRARGFVIKFKREFGQWNEIKISSKEDSYTLENLHCGTKYLLYMAAIGKKGEGESSEIIHGRTEGTAPIAPEKDIFVVANSTHVTLFLSTWDDGNCPVKSFTIRYKRLHTADWRLVSNNIVMQQDPVILRDLSPGTWYSIRVTAHNSAGSTVAEYDVATLTLDGATIAPIPILASKESPQVWQDLNIIVPVIVAITALSVVISVAVCVCIKRRNGIDDLYERPNTGTGTMESSQVTSPTSKKIEDTAVITRETTIYQSAPGKLQNPPRSISRQERLNANYEDDVAPYATFRLPGLDSDAESSHETVRELQTFGHQYQRPFQDSSSHHQQEVEPEWEADLRPKYAGYQIYEAPFSVTSWSSVPGESLYRQRKTIGDPAVSVLLEDYMEAKQNIVLCRRYVCLEDPSRYGYDDGSLFTLRKQEANFEFGAQEQTEEDVLIEQLSEAECDWDQTACCR